MPDVQVDDFSRNILQMGVDVTQYSENDLLYLRRVATLCLKSAGLPLGAAAGVAMSGVGTVTIPILGAVPGYVAGFLAGAIGGTVSCTISRISIKRGLDDLLESSSWSTKNNVINSNAY